MSAIGRIFGSDAVKPKDGGEKQPVVDTLLERLQKSNVWDVGASMQSVQAGAYGK